jgi:RimJ/RimL family protein N-acetyltransferase
MTTAIPTVKIRAASVHDLELIMAWRSNPEIYQYFYEQTQPLTWSEHLSFWQGRQQRVDWIISYFDGQSWRKVGTVNATNLDSKTPEVGILIGEVTLHGQGVGTKAIELVLEWLKKKRYKEVHARVLKKNRASQALFEKNHFVQGAAQPGTDLLTYTRKLHEESV